MNALVNNGNVIGGLIHIRLVMNALVNNGNVIGGIWRCKCEAHLKM